MVTLTWTGTKHTNHPIHKLSLTVRRKPAINGFTIHRAVIQILAVHFLYCIDPKLKVHICQLTWTKMWPLKMCKSHVFAIILTYELSSNSQSHFIIPAGPFALNSLLSFFLFSFFLSFFLVPLFFLFDCCYERLHFLNANFFMFCLDRVQSFYY